MTKGFLVAFKPVILRSLSISNDSGADSLIIWFAASAVITSGLASSASKILRNSLFLLLAARAVDEVDVLVLSWDVICFDSGGNKLGYLNCPLRAPGFCAGDQIGRNPSTPTKRLKSKDLMKF